MTPDHKRRHFGSILWLQPAFTRSVVTGEELFIDYGPDFCKFFDDEPIWRDLRLIVGR